MTTLAKSKATPSIAEAWRPLLDAYRSRFTGHQKELTAVWQGMRGQLDQMEQILAQSDGLELEPDRLSSMSSCFTGMAEELLFEPVRERDRVMPQRKALWALAGLRSSLDDVARQAPATVWTTGRDLAEHVTGVSTGGLRRRWLRTDKKLRPLELRRLVQWQVEQDELNRAQLDGDFQLLLAKASLHLIGPWHVFRQRSLDLLEDGREASGKVERIRRRWLRRKKRLLVTGEKLLQRYGRWFDAAPERLVTTVLSRPRIPESSDRGAVRLATYFDYWSRQQRAVYAVINLEMVLAQLAAEVAESGRRVLDSLDQEHEAVLAEVDAVVEWLQASGGAGGGDQWPEARASLLSAETRSSELVKELSDKARARLPEAIEAVNPKGALPGWRNPWRRLEPEAIFLRVLAGARQEAATSGMREAEAAHRAIVREIEHAREVVAYAGEAAQQGEEDGVQIAAEGIGNAISLLEYHRSHAMDVRPPAERSLTRGLALGLLECYISLDQGRLGLLTHLAQEASERGLRRMAVVVLENSRRGYTAAFREVRKSWGRVLVLLGLRTPSTPPTSSVARAKRLSEVLESRLIRPELPLIYRRLFRVEPVEELRFLVGRDDEMAGLVEARVQWMTRQAVSVMVVGARGSGKTSLLNCGTQVAFEGLPLIRTQFTDRITTAVEMEQFLRTALEIPEGVGIREGLANSRQVIVLEEVERTFIRRMNGFAGLRYLLDLVASTWHDVLWVLSLNESAHQFLDRAVEFDRYFTHRLNALAVKDAEIQEAILARHKLSGYRIAFPPVPEADPGIRRLRKTLGFEREAEDLFFEALYNQSEGIFRAAFEIWENHIERIEGGVVYLRQPVEPTFGPLQDALSHLDSFTLHAIQQHGGLSGNYLAEIFDETPLAGQSRIERLLAMELLESDPGGPGFRIRPEAGRLVRELLHRQNL